MKVHPSLNQHSVPRQMYPPPWCNFLPILWHSQICVSSIDLSPGLQDFQTNHHPFGNLKSRSNLTRSKEASSHTPPLHPSPNSSSMGLLNDTYDIYLLAPDPNPRSDSFFFIFSFIFISWRLITLQYCSRFCHTMTWISHGYTCIPHPNPPSHLPLHPIPLGLPSAPGPSTCLKHPTWAGDLFHYR